VGGGVPGARAALPRKLPSQYSASAGGGHDRVRDGTGWIAAAFAHARHPPTHRGLSAENCGRSSRAHSSVLSPSLSQQRMISKSRRKR